MREMKDSGIEWIGMIPTDWNIVRIGNQYTERKTKVSDRDYPPLSVTMKGILPQLASAAKTDAHDDRKLVCKGDFAINSRSDRRGSCGISAYDGSVSLINTILQPRDEMNPQYYVWLFHSPMFSDEFYKWGHGIVDDLWTTNWQDMKRISIPEPPLAEQQKIASFLDRKCDEIDAVIEKTKVTIEEYKKLKQSVITDAVTKGVRGNRPMKNSGIEWIGEIPADWDMVRKLSYVCTGFISYGIVKLLEPDDENGVKVLRCSDVLPGKVSLVNVRTVTQKVSNEYARTILSGGEIVINVRGTLGGCAIVPQELKGYNVAREVAVIPLQDNICNRYFMYFFLSDIFIDYQNRYLTGSVYVGLNIELLSSCPIVFPAPKEQAEIADYLDKKCNEIDTLIAQKSALLGEMEAYKKSVIYEYVTGKKEVGTVEQSTAAIFYPYFPAVLSTKKTRFAQAVLMSRILDKCRKKMGRVKLEKMLYTIETSIGFDFDTEYVRQAAGPLDESIYDCEAIISRKNKWYTKKESKYGVSYTPAKDNAKYKKYYDRYFSDYDSEIERIIGIFMDYDADQAEIIATLFAAWNDFIIDQRQFTDEELVDEVLNNWNDSKKRFSKDVWLRAIEQMRQNNIVPKGYGKRTVIKK